MTSAVLDRDCFLVPLDATDDQVREASGNDNPEVIEAAKREQFKELGGIVFNVLVARPPAFMPFIKSLTRNGIPGWLRSALTPDGTKPIQQHPRPAHHPGIDSANPSRSASAGLRTAENLILGGQAALFCQSKWVAARGLKPAGHRAPPSTQKEQLANHKEHKERKEGNLGKGWPSPAR